MRVMGFQRDLIQLIETLTATSSPKNSWSGVTWSAKRCKTGLHSCYTHIKYLHWKHDEKESYDKFDSFNAGNHPQKLDMQMTHFSSQTGPKRLELAIIAVKRHSENQNFFHKGFSLVTADEAIQSLVLISLFEQMETEGNKCGDCLEDRNLKMWVIKKKLSNDWQWSKCQRCHYIIKLIQVSAR